MKTEKRKLEVLVENPDNVRIHGQQQINEFVRSIKQFGVIRPIVIDENNVILCGNGLYEALKQMGATEADVIVKTGLTDKQKKKLLLADNKVFQLGIDDFDAIDKIMADLVGDFDIPGYNADDLELLYGKSGITDVTQGGFEVPKIEPKSVEVRQQSDNPNFSVSGDIVSIQTATEHNEKYIICPHCGERIYLDD